jgi:serine/threonine protein kinase
MAGEPAAEEQFGPYAVYERLGVGGMATVHRALERGPDGFERMVALKRLLPHLAEDASFIKSFVREAKLASILNHLNIVQIYELGRVGAEYFISMEYIDGRDVRRILRHARKVTGPPPIHVTVALLIQLCEALDYAHAKVDDNGEPLKLVHRDVSPSNLIVTSAGHLKVIDFGIAKAESAQLRTQTGRVKGKLAYMAPEAIAGGRDLDARSDLWAVGVILHELLTARPLFASKNEYQTLLKVQKGEIMPPSTFNQACPAELDAIVFKALARSPDDRFNNAAEMREELIELKRQYQLQTGYRDVAAWLDWAFSLEQPPGFGNQPTTGVSEVDPIEKHVRAKTPRPTRNADEEEAVAMVWGNGEGEGTADDALLLDEVPDVSRKPARLDTDNDDIPNPQPSHGANGVYADSLLTLAPEGAPPVPDPAIARGTDPPVARGTNQMRAPAVGSQPKQRPAPRQTGQISVPKPAGTERGPQRATSPNPVGSPAGTERGPQRATSPNAVAKPAQRQSDRQPAQPTQRPSDRQPAQRPPSDRQPAQPTQRQSDRQPAQRPPSDRQPAHRTTAPGMAAQRPPAQRSQTAPTSIEIPLDGAITPVVRKTDSLDAAADAMDNMTTPVPDGFALPAIDTGPSLRAEDLFAEDSSADLAAADNMATSLKPKSAPRKATEFDVTTNPVAAPMPEAELPAVPVVRFSKQVTVPPVNAPADQRRPASVPPANQLAVSRTTSSQNVLVSRTTSQRLAVKSPSQVLAVPRVTVKKSSKRVWLFAGLGVLIAGGAAAMVVLNTAKTHASEAAHVTATPTPVAPEIMTGTVKVVTEPADAEIHIEGMPPHTGSPWAVDLPAGIHQVEIRMAGYKSWMTSLELSSHETQTLRVVLEKLDTASQNSDATLTISTTPAGLEALLDGQPLAEKTPTKTSVKLGSHTISVKQNGVEVWHQTFKAEASSDYEFNPSFTADKQRERAQRAVPEMHVEAPKAEPPVAPAPMKAELTPPPAVPDPKAPPPAAAPPSQPVVVLPNQVSRVSGVLPEIAALKGTEVPDVISTKLCIDVAGKVTSATVLTKLDHEAASQLSTALGKWVYTPYAQNGAAVPACFVLTLRVK